VSAAPLLREAGFRRLFTARLLSQLADGVFQASLAGAVFFNPDHATDPKQAALGFLVLYLPYSVVSPFVGVILDRWRRQRSLLACCAIRVPLVAVVALLLATVGAGSLWLYLAALLVLGVSRFFIAAAGAALPHVVDDGRLVTANSIAGTSGTVAAFVAGILALLVRAALPPSNGTDAAIALGSAVAYVLAAAALLRFRSDALGPDTVSATTPLRREAERVLLEMRDGAAHLRTQPVAIRALAAITAYRLCMGALTLAAVLLYRNSFAGVHGLFPGGQTGLAEMVGASAAGIFACAVVTPRVTERIGTRAWTAVLLVVAGVTVATLAPTYRPAAFLVAGLIVGAVGQGVKICVDTLLQETISDAYRGRVFAFYDALFNCAFAIAAVLAAFALPTSGRSLPVIGGVAALFLVAGLAYGRSERSAVQPA
jgi:MFS family permease